MMISLKDKSKLGFIDHNVVRRNQTKRKTKTRYELYYFQNKKKKLKEISCHCQRVFKEEK